MADGLNFSRRLRRTPYTDCVEEAGVRGFSVVNHMLLPKAYQTTVEQDYWHLREHVQIWDVSCQRQVQIEGPDAEMLVQWMTPRDISKAIGGKAASYSHGTRRITAGDTGPKGGGVAL